MRMRVLGDNSGFALYSVIIMIALFTILGTAVWAMSNSDSLHVATDNSKQQAYYYARSGVDVALGIINSADSPVKGIHTYYGDLENGFTRNATDKYSIKFSIFEIDEGLKIESEGRVYGASGDYVKETLSLVINYWQSGGGPPLDMALFSLGNITMEGSASITGDVGINANESGSVNFSGNPAIKGNLYYAPGGDPDVIINKPQFIQESMLELPAIRVYSMPKFPSFPTEIDRGNFSTPWVEGEVYKIDKDGYYPRIEVTSNRTVKIILDGTDRVICVDDLDISQGHIVLEGSGRLLLYINETFNMGGSSTVNYNGNPNDVIMYYKGDETINFSGNQRFTGHFFADEANLVINGSAGITGHIITGGENVTINGGASAITRVIYAPNAIVIHGGSGDVRGTVIAKEYYAGGAASLVFDDSLDTSFFNQLDWGEDSVEKIWGR